MKPIGCTVKVSNTGKALIPKELRKKFGIIKDTEIEIDIDGDLIILKKYVPRCIICGGGQNHIEFKESIVCPDCVNSIKFSITQSTIKE